MDEMTEKLRKQFNLLAERSNECLDELLPDFTSVMLEIYKELQERS